MPLRAPAPCLHELRPGTKVCLHCRRAEREARAAHRNRILGRIVVCAIGLGVAVASAKAGFEAYQRGALPKIPDLMAATTKAIVETLPRTPAAAPLPEAGQVVSGRAVADSASVFLMASDSGGAIPVGAPGTLAAVPADSATAQPTMMMVAPGDAAVAPDQPIAAPPTPGASAALPAGPPPAPLPPVAAAPASVSLRPVVSQGRTELAGGMFAVRAGDTVTVHFDTPEARTRRPEKFEQIVRATLPQVHGAAAQTLLASITPGALIGAVDLVNELPTRGLHLTGAGATSLSLWPETRPGRDGPLVVAYRVTPAR